MSVFSPDQGQQQSGPGGGDKSKDKDKKKKYEPPIPTRVGKKRKKVKGPDAANKLPQGETDGRKEASLKT